MTNQDILEWDIPTWSRALFFWKKIIAAQNLELRYGLEIGAHNGGISLFFAKCYGAKMVCSDLVPPSEKAKSLHLNNGVRQLIQYVELDASSIPFPDNTFDFVVFKSVLGAVGRNGHPEKQQQVLAEIHRVLKPGGALFFAENLRGAGLHRLARRLFVPWGKSWRYLKINELEEWLSIFGKKELHATGFFAAFVSKPGWIKTLVAKTDTMLFFLPRKWGYLGYGYALK